MMNLISPILGYILRDMLTHPQVCQLVCIGGAGITSFGDQ